MDREETATGPLPRPWTVLHMASLTGGFLLLPDLVHLTSSTSAFHCPSKGCPRVAGGTLTPRWRTRAYLSAPMTPQALATKENIETGLLPNAKCLCMKEHYHQSEKTAHRMGEIFANRISNKGPVSKIQKAFLQRNTHKRTNNSIRKRTKDMNRYFSKKDTQMAKECMKRCSVSSGVWKMQVKITMEYHFTPVRMMIKT